MRKYLFILALALCGTYSCRSGVTKNEVLSNGKIDAKLRTAMSEMNRQVYKYMCDNNYGELSKMFTDTLRDAVKGDFSTKFMPQIARVIKGHEYKLTDEFYIRTVKVKDTGEASGGSGDGEFTFKYTTGSNETFISMIVAGDSVNEVMLTIVYSKVNGKWQVNNVKGEDYTLGGRNAMQLCNYALELEKKGDLIDAFNYVTLAGHCTAPGGNTFRYKKWKELQTFTDTLIKETNSRYGLPYTVNELTTKPKVVNVHLEVVDRAFVPMIIYQSSIWVNDTVSLRKENDVMKGKIGSIFTGIDKNNKTILYRAYNELPNGQNNPPYYGYMQKID